MNEEEVQEEAKDIIRCYCMDNTDEDLVQVVSAALRQGLKEGVYTYERKESDGSK